MLGAAWVYLPSESVISNDNAIGKSTDYVLNVQVRDAANRTLTLGKGSAGDAFKACGGTTLDLSERIEDADGNQWTIEVLAYNALRSSEAPYTTIVLPKELTASSGQQFNIQGRTFESVTMDCPNWAGNIEQYFLCGAKSGTIKLPKITKLEHASLGIAGDVTDWDLSGVETFKDSPFYWQTQQGTLNLPSVKAMGRVANNMQYDRVLLGTRHLSLESVDGGGFATDTAKGANRYVAEVVLGGAKGWTIGSGAFLTMKLTRVYMVGAVPTFADSEVAFGLDKKEKEMVFYVPDTEEWATIRANATELTEEDIEEFKAAHPDWAVPFGVVAADVFQTEYPQYIGIVNPADCGVYQYASVGNRSAGQYGDSVSITVDGEEVTTGDVPYGSIVTVTATPKDSATVVTWEGKLPDGTIPTGNSFTYTATADAAFYAVFTHPWEYDAEAATISDGYWTVSVTADSDNTLTVNGLASSNTGKGELNLSGRVYTKGDTTTTWTITKTAGKAFKDDKLTTSFYSPTAGFVEFGMQLFNNAYAVTNAVLNCPDITTKEIFSWGYTFSYCPLARLVLNVPNAANIGNNNESVTGILPNATMEASDLSEWDLSSLKFITQYGLQAGNANGVGPKGDLVLPNVETICQKAFNNWKRVESAALGTNGTLKTLGATIFANNTSTLTKLDFGKSYDFTTEATTFLANDTTPLPLNEVWFADKAPSTTTLDNILALRGAADTALTTDSVKVFAPLSLKSWRDVTTGLMADEAAAKAELKNQGYKVIGVYVKTTGERAAWLVQNPAFKYTDGFMLMIR